MLVLVRVDLVVVAVSGDDALAVVAQAGVVVPHLEAEGEAAAARDRVVLGRDGRELRSVAVDHELHLAEPPLVVTVSRSPCPAKIVAISCAASGRAVSEWTTGP